MQNDFSHDMQLLFIIITTQSKRVLRPRGDGVDYGDDEDDPVRPLKRLKKGKLYVLSP